jgi:hypothetical protein
MKSIRSIIRNTHRWFTNSSLYNKAGCLGYIYKYYYLEKFHLSSKKLLIIKSPNPANKNRLSWGDFHLANALKDAISMNDEYNCLTIPINYWNNKFINRKADKIIFLRGVYPDLEGQEYRYKTYMYFISHPDNVSPEEMKEFKGVIIASLQLFNHVNDLGINAHYIPQFTNENNFYAQESEQRYQCDVLFVGNTRGIYRESVKYCIQNNIDVNVYGQGWEEFIPAQYIKGHYIDNGELGKYYANAKITLNDHWQSMRDNGFISNRVFDVTACGGFLLSDHFDEIEKLYNGSVETYKSEKELIDKIQFYLNNETERQDKSTLAKEITLKRHTKKAIGQSFSEVINK